ncbi:MAG: FtsX-like permease family protein [Chloroflexaceae bacterium]|nr:FtsX-like permease family protein [Chloroflexaceae bacterium]
MFAPRWKKVRSDLWANRIRTILVSLSIAIGVFSVGFIFGSRERMLRGLSEGYLAGAPFSGVLTTKEPFDQDLLETIRNIEGVEDADARRGIRLRLKIGPNQWKNLNLDAIDDFEDIRVARMAPFEGAWPPPDKAMLLERSALNPMLGTTFQTGDTVLVETLDQKQRKLPIAGFAHDLNQPPAFITGEYYGYMTEETLKWFGETPGLYNAVMFRVDRQHFFDREFITTVAKAIEKKIEKSGREVDEIFIPPDPGVSPTASFGLEPLLVVLSAVGVLAVFLSGFLVTNTISGLLAQQIRAIGIMKSLGARNAQVMLMYFVLVVCFGLIALVIGAPPAEMAARAFTNFFASMFNFDPLNIGIIPEVLALELLVSIVVPVTASVYSIIRGTTMTVREALDATGGAGTFGTSLFDRIINHIRGLPRPVLLSLRNTFRRKGRLLLTLTTLTLAGGTFIAVFSAKESVALTLDELFGAHVRYDVYLDFDGDYRSDEIVQEALQVPGVAHAETWGSTSCRRLRSDQTESDTIFLAAAPEGSTLLKPEMLEGRWLLPEDENGIALSTGLLKKETDIHVGDTITLKIKGREITWRVVGIFVGFGNELMAYANRPYFEREVREQGVADNVRVVTAQHDATFQQQVQEQLEAHFRRVGLDVSSSTTRMAEYQAQIDIFNIIIYSLLIMAVLTAVVGGLGMAGTMSMNVLERTREIGVMRAIGASNLSIQQIVLIEGMMMSLIGWWFSILLAFPIGLLLSYAVGTLFTGAPLSYAFSVQGTLVWLAIALVIAFLACFIPAWNASRLTIRNVLAYE